MIFVLNVLPSISVGEHVLVATVITGVLIGCLFSSARTTCCYHDYRLENEASCEFA